MAGTSNDGGEDSPGGVITGETGLAHAGAVVNDKSGNILVTHLGFVGLSGFSKEERYELGSASGASDADENDTIVFKSKIETRER